MKKILLIGGGGYVGSVIISDFLRKGYQVNVIERFVYNNQYSIISNLSDKNFKLFVGDFSDTEVLTKASKDVDNVVILAGLVGDPITKKYPNESNFINDIGVKKCMDFFDESDIKKLIFISTCSNYGLIKENELADEEFDLNPLSLYSKAKVSAENHLMSKKNKVSYSGTVLRFATAFGLSTRMRFDLTISEFTKELFFENVLSVFDEHTWRPYCHVLDFSTLIDKVINVDKEKIDFQIFNAGGEKNNLTKKMIIDLIIKHIPKANVSYVKQGSDPRNYRVSFEKVKNILNFSPKYSVEDGIIELIGALKIGLWSDSIDSKEKYGNYHINFKK